MALDGRWFSMIIMVCLLVALTPSVAFADIAPPQPPLGSGVIPGQATTQVRMMAETVLIELPTSSTYENWQAAVTATFTMRNLGDTAESMTVRFPMFMTENYPGTEAGCSFIGNNNYPTIQNFRVLINDAPTGAQTTYNETNDPKPCWAEFPAAFPPGKDVKVEVRYQILGQLYGHGVTNYLGFPYILTTGRGWQGTIGSADITVRLPYPLSDLNVKDIQPDGQISGNEVRWHFEDFEPENNTSVWVANPGAWQALLRYLEAVKVNPKDGETWGQIGKAYKGVFLLDRGFREGEAGVTLFHLSQEAYQKSVDLLPNDADWHYGYGELMCETSFWNSTGYYKQLPTNEDLLTTCMKQLQLALQINPTHAKTLELLQNMSFNKGIVDMSGSQPDFLILTPGNYKSPTPWFTPTTVLTSTATPQPPAIETATLSPTTAPSATQAPVVTRPTPPSTTPTPTAKPNPGLPACGASFFPLLVGLWIGWRKWGLHLII
jgi:hypothetical protein